MSEDHLIAQHPIDISTRWLSDRSEQADVEHITILAHELRNYLTPAYSHLGMLLRRAQQEQREQDIRAAVRGRQALDHALLLISNLLEEQRAARGLFELRTQPCDLSLVVRQAADVFDTGDRPIILRTCERVILSADRERVRQVLHNLLANALRHAPGGAPITLDLHTERRGRDGWATLIVHNTGPAIPAHLLPQLFHRFAAGPESPGLGLGLYLARGIAEAHGGMLTVHSSDGRGTRFVLTLPLTAEIASDSSGASYIG